MELKSIMKDEVAEPGNVLSDAVTLFVALILAATLGVAAWQLLGNANYTGVDATTKTLVQTVVGIIAAVGTFIIILRASGIHMKMGK